jgi:N-dimethylarginine dimethylaminohydrolase
MYYPPAFDELALSRIHASIHPSLRIVVSEEDALNFACNAVNSGQHIFLNKASPELTAELEARGFTVVQAPLGEFMKAGGGAKCLTLKLNEE